MDYFTPDPGEEKEMFCEVCKTGMDVQRNVMGATGFAEAMGRKGHLHDFFQCPFRKTDWHNQARILMQRINKETSNSITEILLIELSEVLEKRKTTKDMPWEYLH